jgi:ribonuclease Y
MTAVIILLAVLLVGSLAGAFYLYQQIQNEKKQREEAERKLSNLSEEEKIKLLDSLSKKKIDEAERHARDIVQRAQKEILEKKRDLVDVEKAILERDKVIQQKSDSLLQKERKLEDFEKQVEKERDEVKAERSKVADKLSEVAGLSKEEAKTRLLAETKNYLEKEYAVAVKNHRDTLEKEQEEIAKEIIIDAMTNAGTDYVSEYTTTIFPVAGEEVKGKIIGKEGRNIRTFEKLTGVELIMDESDNYVVLSCFDPLRRELAKITLERLVKDGRIHPARIEEFVQKARVELAKQIIKDGEEIAFKAGFPNYPLEHLKFLGRMKYRFSYGQCLATHVLEVVNFAEKVAKELNLDVNLAKECALWHDIGKVASQDKEGNHMELGEEIGVKLGLKPEVINAMYAHHMAKDPVCFESAIIYVADANSGGRPGARYGSHEDYVKRIRALEDVAKGHDEVKEAYALDAGREVRVFVDPVMAGDDRITVLSTEIAKEIQTSQTYPGTVKVTVIREIRASSTAK